MDPKYQLLDTMLRDAQMAAYQEVTAKPVPSPGQGQVFAQLVDALTSIRSTLKHARLDVRQRDQRGMQTHAPTCPLGQYLAQWPWHCPLCMGSGTVFYRGEPDDACACQELGRCPRCNGRDVYELCPHCGWDLEAHLDAMASYLTCTCGNEGHV